MDIVVDLTPFYEFLNLPPVPMLWKLFWVIGWLPVSITMLWGFFQMWVLYRQDVFSAKQKYIFLAIDIPKANEQSPKAVENFFAYLAGAHSTLNLIDQYWDGKFQLAFSCEVASIEGYTQFLIRTPEQFRNLVESGIYSQYPDAEITEVNDYTTEIPINYPNDEYDVWGAEFIPARNEAYPIKTYKDFEHQMGDPETHFRDPMASLMDLCSTLGPGEQLWYQILVWPTGFDWPKIGEKEISKILKEKPKVKENIIFTVLNGFVDFVMQIIGLAIVPGEEKKPDDALKMMNLKPAEKKQVEAIQEKVSKLGLQVKIRMVYVAKKEVMNKGKVVNGFVGYMKQYVYNDLNNLKPDMDITATSTSYLFKQSRLNERKRKIVSYFKKRTSMGRSKYHLNVEELASLWHFPIESVVKAPLIQKTPGKKATPPTSLPFGEVIVGKELRETLFEDALEPEKAKAAPSKEDLFFEVEAPETPKKKSKEEKSADEDGLPPENLPFA